MRTEIFMTLLFLPGRIAGIVNEIIPRSPTSTSFPNHFSSIILSLYVIYGQMRLAFLVAETVRFAFLRK